MRAPKRETNKRSRARTAVKAAGFALFALAGAPAAGDFPQATPAVEAAAQHRAAKKVEGWWIFERCTGDCPGHGRCCGTSVV